MQLLFYHRRPGTQANDGANGFTLLSVIGMLFKEGLLFCRRCSEAQADRMRTGVLCKAHPLVCRCPSKGAGR